MYDRINHKDKRSRLKDLFFNLVINKCERIEIRKYISRLRLISIYSMQKLKIR